MTIYFDHNATTPVDPQVLEAMLPYLEGTFGNPSSIHRYGQQARRGLDLAREQVADLVGAEPDEIVFTSGGTESDNQAIRGVLGAKKTRGNHIVTSAIEHQAVLSTCHFEKTNGVETTYVGVDRSGRIDPLAIEAAITDATVLVSIMTANNDVGTIQPVAEIAAIAHSRGVTVHSDAVQSAGKIVTNVQKLGADLISLSSHKLYGPKGAGALCIRSGTRTQPILHGGHHESHRRAGTENVPAIVGFGKACALAQERLGADAAHIRALRDRLQTGIESRIAKVRINGHPNLRLPGTLNVSFANVEGETLLMALDLKGVATSTGSACSSDTHEPSHVLAAMACPVDLARGAIRFSLGRNNTLAEVDQTLEILNDVVGRIRGSKQT